MSAADWLILPLLVVGISLMVWLNLYIWPLGLRMWRELPQRRRANEEFMRAHPPPDAAADANRRASHIGNALLAVVGLVFLAAIVIVLVLIF